MHGHQSTQMQCCSVSVQDTMLGKTSPRTLSVREIQCVQHTLSHTERWDQSSNRCVPTFELLLSADISSCTWSDCVRISDTKMPDATLKPWCHRARKCVSLSSSSWRFMHDACEFMRINDCWLLILSGWSRRGDQMCVWMYSRQGEINSNDVQTIREGHTIADSVEQNKYKAWMCGLTEFIHTPLRVFASLFPPSVKRKCMQYIKWRLCCLIGWSHWHCNRQNWRVIGVKFHQNPRTPFQVRW